jgi:hypothetical protein
MKSTARKSGTKAQGATKTHGATSGELVRTTFPVALVWFYFWVVSPLGWPADFVFIDIVSGKFGDPYSSLTPRYIGIGLAVVPTWLLWRAISRCAGPSSDGSGLRIRSWFRSFDVPWGRVQDVAWMEPGTGRNLRFSHTIVTFEADRERRVIVSMSWRSGSAGAMRILSWAPPGHPLRHRLPPEWREATPVEIDGATNWDGLDDELPGRGVDDASLVGLDSDEPNLEPAPQNGGEVEAPALDSSSLDEIAGLSRPDQATADWLTPNFAAAHPTSGAKKSVLEDGYTATVDAPITDVLRPSPQGRRRTAGALGAVTVVMLMGGLGMSADHTSIGWGFAIATWSCTVVPIYAVVRAFGLRIELSDKGMVVYGLLTTSVYPRAEIFDLVVSDTGSGPMPRLILAGRGSRALSAAAAGRQPDPAMLGRLAQWLEETKHLAPGPASAP